MKKLTRKPNPDRTDILILLYSFFIPALVVLVCFLLKGLAPFGERSLVSMDGFSQYYPMLMNMSEAVKEGELFYSFKGALGFNLWAQNAYYTNSPLWLLLYQLPHSFQVTAIDLIILLKVSLAGLFFALRLIKKESDENYIRRFLTFTLCSVAYALSGYMLAFINQLMWTDVIVLLPLIILGAEELFEKRKPLLYMITLFLSVWSCFYISYMVCLFLCLYFVYLSFKNKHSFRYILQRGVLFAFSSLFAGGAAAVVLVPTAKALQLTMASDMGFEGTLQLKYTLFEFLKQLLPFRGVSLEFGAPNLYCSVAAVFLVLCFFLLKKVSLRERVVSFVFVTFMAFSMSLNLGEFVWHGFHYPNQLPARQSFLLIFLILALASKAPSHLSFKKQGFFNFCCILSIITVSLSFMGIFLKDTWTSRQDSLQRYESSFEKLTEDLDKDGFLRMEWTAEKKNNLPQQCTYNGICYYSSTMTADAYNFFQNLGMERYAARVSTHYTGSEITDDIFGIKYILREKKVYNSEDERFEVEVNGDCLPLGYLSKKDVVSLDLSEYKKGKESQQALFDSIAPESINDYSDALSYLKRNGLQITEFDTDYIKGTATTEEDGVFLFSIPFDEGWKVTVDKKEVPTQKAAGYLLSIELLKGEHELELSYTVPGIKAGLIISLVSVIGIFATAFVTRKKEGEII